MAERPQGLGGRQSDYIRRGIRVMESEVALDDPADVDCPRPSANSMRDVRVASARGRGGRIDRRPKEEPSLSQLETPV